MTELRRAATLFSLDRLAACHVADSHCSFGNAGNACGCVFPSCGPSGGRQPFPHRWCSRAPGGDQRPRCCSSQPKHFLQQQVKLGSGCVSPCWRLGDFAGSTSIWGRTIPRGSALRLFCRTRTRGLAVCFFVGSDARCRCSGCSCSCGAVLLACALACAAAFAVWREQRQSGAPCARCSWDFYTSSLRRPDVRVRAGAPYPVADIGGFDGSGGPCHGTRQQPSGLVWQRCVRRLRRQRIGGSFCPSTLLLPRGCCPRRLRRGGSSGSRVSRCSDDGGCHRRCQLWGHRPCFL